MKLASIIFIKRKVKNETAHQVQREREYVVSSLQFAIYILFCILSLDEASCIDEQLILYVK